MFWQEVLAEKILHLLLRTSILFYYFFFFQAEDGIRAIGVPGVQTCALPICIYEEYLSLLRKYMRENAVKYGISRMGIFGSVARGEQHDGSDVDICVEIDRPSIFTLVHIKEELEKLFKCPVDVVRLRNNMDELLRNCINKDGIYV